MVDAFSSVDNFILSTCIRAICVNFMREIQVRVIGGGPRMPPAFSYTFWSMEESWSGAVSLNSSCVETGGFVVSKLKREKNRDA